MGVRFVLPVDESIGEVVLSGNYYLQSSIWLDDSALQSANSFGKQKGYGELNLRADWNGIGGSPIDLSVFVRNVTNNLHPVGYGSQIARTEEGRVGKEGVRSVRDRGPPD